MKNVFVRATNLLILVLAVMLPYPGGSAPYCGVRPSLAVVAENAFSTTTIHHSPVPVMQPTARLSNPSELLPSETTEEQKEERSLSDADIPSTAFAPWAGGCALVRSCDLSSSWAVAKRYLLFHALRIAC